MRTAPKHICLLAACLCALLLSLPLQAQTNKKIRTLQKEQTTLKKNIADQEQMLRSTKKDVKSQLANLQVINTQIEGQQKYVDGIHTELTTLAGSIGELEKQLSALEADLSDCKRKYQRAVTYMFRNRMQLSKWQFILSAKNFRQMYRRMRYMTDFSKYQRAQGEIIAKKEAEVQAKRAELLGIKNEKDRLFQEGQAQKQKLEGQQKERQQVVNELNKKQSALQKTIAQQRKKAAELDARIDRLIQQEIAAAERRRKAEEEKRRKAEAARLAKEKAERERAERKQNAATAKTGSKNAKTGGKATASGGKNAKAGTGSSKQGTAKNSSKSKTTKGRGTSSDNYDVQSTPRFREADSADRKLSGNFAANKGRLPMPITGSYAITTHFGSYSVAGLSGVTLDSKGINITGRPGAQARAVYEGEVTSVFSYGGMYNVIVRHGSYMSVYCNLSSTSVRTGQRVSTRQTLGSVATDASGNCTLHFQLRKETSKLNPEQWLGR